MVFRNSSSTDVATNSVSNSLQGLFVLFTQKKIGPNLLNISSVLLQYRYNQPNLAPLVQSIIRIVLNTLESQYHRCYRYGGIGATLSHGHPSTAQHQLHGVSSTATMRMRDQSQGSLEVETPIDPTDLKGFYLRNSDLLKDF